MYPNRVSFRVLRDRGAEYLPLPGHRELRAAHPILRDLRAVPETGLPLVLIRFAVAHYWLLRLTDAPADALAGAAAAARTHLRMAPPEWPEGRLLTALLDRPEPPRRAVRLLRAAAARAARDGHVASAEGLLGTAWVGAVLRLEYRGAAAAARAMARLLAETGAAAEAAEWRGRAERAAAQARLWLPPSTS